MKIREIIGEAPIIGAGYFNQPFDRTALENIIQWIDKNVDLNSFDLIVGTGMSGNAIVPVLAHVFHKRFALIRKSAAKSHSAAFVAGNVKEGDRWIFFDDLIDTGRTLTRVQRAMARETKSYKTKYVGNILYRHREITSNLKKKRPRRTKS